jgi:hypothetical protein
VSQVFAACLDINQVCNREFAKFEESVENTCPLQACSQSCLKYTMPDPWLAIPLLLTKIKDVCPAKN